MILCQLLYSSNPNPIMRQVVGQYQLVPARGLEISEVISFDPFLQKLDQWQLQCRGAQVAGGTHVISHLASQRWMEGCCLNPVTGQQRHYANGRQPLRSSVTREAVATQLPVVADDGRGSRRWLWDGTLAGVQALLILFFSLDFYVYKLYYLNSTQYIYTTCMHTLVPPASFWTSPK